MMQFPSLNFSIIDFFIVKISYVTITLGEGGVGVSPNLINVINFTAFLRTSLTYFISVHFCKSIINGYLSLNNF